LFRIRSLLADIIFSKLPNTRFNFLNMRINQRIDSCFRSLVNARAIDRAFDEKCRLATIKLEELLWILLNLCFCYTK
jgi:hypothetical protein